MRKKTQTLEEWMDEAEKDGYTVLLRQQKQMVLGPSDDPVRVDDSNLAFARDFLREHPSVQVVAFKPLKGEE
jgi:hypothetical protein